MKISVFLSSPTPHQKKQKEFLDTLCNYLTSRGFQPRTLGVSDYDMEEPLTAIRRIMLESNGLLAIAFKRTYVQSGVVRFDNDLPNTKNLDISGQWLTSPYCHIEPAMAFQLGLPILILREKGVVADGILEKGVAGTYLPEFDLTDSSDAYFESQEWKQIVAKWEAFVHAVVKNKGCPPKLY